MNWSEISFQLPASSCFHCKGARTHITVTSIKNTLQGMDDSMMVLRFKEYRAGRLRHSRFVWKKAEWIKDFCPGRTEVSWEIESCWDIRLYKAMAGGVAGSRCFVQRGRLHARLRSRRRRWCALIFSLCPPLALSVAPQQGPEVSHRWTRLPWRTSQRSSRKRETSQLRLCCFSRKLTMINTLTQELIFSGQTF